MSCNSNNKNPKIIYNDMGRKSTRISSNSENNNDNSICNGNIII